MRKLFLIIIIFSIPYIVYSQGIAVNNNGLPADSSAIFDVASSSQGILIPRMTQAERLAIQNPAKGLTVFETTSGCFFYWKNSMWWQLCGTPDCGGSSLSVVASYTTYPYPINENEDLELSATPGGGTPPYSYSWSGPNGFSSSLQNPVILNPSSLYSGMYSVTCTDSFGCSVNSDVDIFVCDLKLAATTNSPVALNDTVLLLSNKTGGVMNFYYTWTGPGGYSSIDENPVIINAQYSDTGMYYVTVTDSMACMYNDSTYVSVSSCMSGGSQNFAYTGGVQYWVVPAGVCNITFKVWGAQGNNNGGNGGYAEGKMAVSSGENFEIYVGGQSGYNGGGTGSTGKNGGGASDIRYGGSALSNRIIVAGGGGGAGQAGPGGTGGGGNACSNGAGGGAGNCQGCNPYGLPGNVGTCTSGGTAGASSGGFSGGGGGGGLTSGGQGSSSGGYGAAGTNGVLGIGGDRGVNGGYSCNSGAGGGGGYYGGGGTADAQCAAGGGGGGSSWASSVYLTNLSFTSGTRTGNGYITIEW